MKNLSEADVFVGVCSILNRMGIRHKVETPGSLYVKCYAPNNIDFPIRIRISDHPLAKLSENPNTVEIGNYPKAMFSLNEWFKVIPLICEKYPSFVDSYKIGMRKYAQLKSEYEFRHSQKNVDVVHKPVENLPPLPSLPPKPSLRELIDYWLNDTLQKSRVGRNIIANAPFKTSECEELRERVAKIIHLPHSVIFFLPSGRIMLHKGIDPKEFVELYGHMMLPNSPKTKKSFKVIQPEK